MRAEGGKFVVRVATPEDLPGILAVKKALAISRVDDSATREGFLLGSSPELYDAMIRTGIAYVIDDTVARTIKGIGFALSWELLRETEVWSKRRSVRWTRPVLAALEGGRPGYIEQLAVLPGQTIRFLAPALGLTLVERLCETGHTHILATTVVSPIRNRAALKLLGLINAEPVGEIDEYYPDVGQILSQIHQVDCSAYRALRESPTWKARLLNYLQKTGAARGPHGRLA